MGFLERPRRRSFFSGLAPARMRCCAPPLPPPARARAPGCPRCATLPGPRGLRGRPRPPTVPRRSGSQRPWHLPPPRGPAPIPQPPRQKPGSYLGSLRRVLRDSWSGPPRTRGLPRPNSGLQCPHAQGLGTASLQTQCLGTPHSGLALPRVGDIRTLGNPAVLPLLARRRETQGPLTSWTPREPRPRNSQNAL